MINLAELRRLAEATKGFDWYAAESDGLSGVHSADRPFIAALSPETVLELVGIVERYEKALNQIQDVTTVQSDYGRAEECQRIAAAAMLPPTKRGDG